MISIVEKILALHANNSKLDSGDQFAPCFYLSDSPRQGICSRFPKAHYLVVDSCLLQNQIDLINDANFGDDVIIMQTVWNEIRPNMTVFPKLKDISLMDKLANLTFPEELETKNKTYLYEEHVSLHEVQAQIKSGTMFRGKLRTSPYNYLEANVTINRNNEEVNVVIQGRENINRAVNEDIVAIKLLPKSEWKIKSDFIIDDDAIDEDDESKKIENGDTPKDVKEQISERPMGKVVSIIKRNWRNYCGVIREKVNVNATSTNFFFVPVDKRIPFIRIETRQDKRFWSNIDCWNRDSKYPRGHYVRIIGEACNKETETDVLLLEHEVPHMVFSAQVLNCLPPEGNDWQPKESDLKDRADFRDICVCSVDPPGCTDIDDALHCKDLGNSLYEVGVHIADVSHFIKPGTAIDKEAAERGTTVYLADRRIDMVPGLLSSNLCSLKEKVERLSFSCIWVIDSNTGEIKSTNFTKSIIKSKASLTYAEAQLKIDSKEQDEVSQSLRRLNALAKILKAKRIEKGALVLASANEIKFVEVESETADNELVILEKKLLETNSMVEEFMLLANISVAEQIFKTFPEFAVLRRHPKPSDSNFEELIKAAGNRGFSIDVHDGKSLSESLDKVVDPKNPHLNLMIRMITTRCMSQAVYFCSGALSSDQSLTFAHYGLASEIYTHFTSPIRRYADVMVHRLLSHSIEYETISPTFLAKRKIVDTCEHINMRNMNARRASRSSNELHSYLYVRNSRNSSVEEEGHVFTLKDNALVIFIMHLSFEVIFRLDSKDDWEVDRDRGFVIYKPTKTRIRQFDQVRVELSIDKSAITSFRKQIRVKLLDPKL
ncbi:exosome catalytic subunit dis3 [Blomia tropicalis]|nr:exosome catalytic subunit dis3 [Blomia tropicalis]